jgi:nucleoside-diphosphate-sugar epimerase
LGAAVTRPDLDALVVVCGAGGFIGGHLVDDLLRQGFRRIRAVDLKPPALWYQCFDETENLRFDLRHRADCENAVAGASVVYNLAADMGGMGFIEQNKALCMLNVLINTHLLMASRDARVERYFFASSACVYAREKQVDPSIDGLKEDDAYPATPEDGYGWEKLFGERMCRHFTEDFGLATRVARYHNVYGPYGTYDGGREKAPAAICRKVARAKLFGSDTIEIWGSGEQTRSFTYVDDCIYGTQKLFYEAASADPLNIGSSEKVTINQLVGLVEEIAGVKLKRRYKLDAPKGVDGRNSDNTLIKSLLGWEPTISLREGLEETYRWIYDEIANGRSEKAVVNLA